MTASTGSAQAGQPQLTIQDLTEASVARAVRWHPGGLDDWSETDWACALAGEVGELCNAIKKLRRVQDGIANENDPGRQLKTREAAMAAIGEECADVLIYLVNLAARCDVDLTAATVAKFNATSERYGFPERLSAQVVIQPQVGPRLAISKAVE